MKTATTRRTVMAGVAAAPVAGLPAIAGAVAEDDPIFAAIERHKAAWLAFLPTCDLTDIVLAKQQGRDITEFDEAAFDAANDAETEALEALIETEPTTKAGARAAIKWLLEYNRGCEPRDIGRFAMTILRSPALADREALS
ncbi:MAG: hypothetical protein U1E25_07460 [Methylocystis sp.]